MRPITPAVLLALLLVSAPPLLDAQDIDTQSGAHAASGLVGYNRPPAGWDPLDRYSATAWGQTFTVTPGSTELLSFAFWLRGYRFNLTNGACCLASNIHFSAYLMAWDPVLSRTTGEFLYRSERQAGPGAGPDDVRYGFETGGIALNPSSMYLAFLAVDNDILAELPYNTSEYATVVGREDVYAGGRAVYTSTLVDPAQGSDAADFRAQLWGAPYPSLGIDAKFTADFAPAQTTVPEPASLALLGSGLAGLAGWRRRRRRVRED